MVGVVPSVKAMEVTTAWIASSPSSAAFTCAAVSEIVAVAPSDTKADPWARTCATVSFAATMPEMRECPSMVARPADAVSICAAVSVMLSWTPPPRCAWMGTKAAAVAASVAVPSDKATVPRSLPSAARPLAWAAMAAPVSLTSIDVPPARSATSGSNPVATATATGLVSVSVMVPRCAPSASRLPLSATTCAAVSDTFTGEPASTATKVCSPAAASAETAPVSVGVTDARCAPRLRRPATFASMLAMLSVTAASIASDVSAAPLATTLAAVSAMVRVKPLLL